MTDGTGISEFLAARDLLLERRGDLAGARERFRWPRPERFNWALDYFDGVLAVERGEQQALRLVEDDGSQAAYTFAALADSSSRLAGWLASHGVGRGMRVLLVLGNQVELWESMLACMKLGAVIIPATTLLSPADLADRLERGAVGAVICRSDLTAGFGSADGRISGSADGRISGSADGRISGSVSNQGDYLRVAVGPAVEGWLDYAGAAGFDPPYSPDG
ncbi:MAG: AMP-binding protein, partial [Actinobacteria bacterium]|nr:AMP-binding protein [Actinomycetota bacterium]